MEILTYSKKKYEIDDQVKVWEWNIQYLCAVKERKDDNNPKLKGKRYQYKMTIIRVTAERTYKKR